MQERSNILLNQEKSKITTTNTAITPKCKTSPDCDLSSVKKQLTQLNSKSTVNQQQQQRKLSAIIDSITFQNSPTSNEPNYLDQENRAPTEMSTCDSEELITNSEMVETHESDDSASDTGAIVGNFWSGSRSANNNKAKINGTNKNKRKQSRPLRCSTYLRDRNNSLDSAIDLGDHISKSSEEDEDEYGAQIVPQARNGCHVMEVATANGDNENEENGNDYKYLMRNPSGLPCVFTIQPNALESDMDSPQHSDMESYVLSDRENGNGTPLSERDSDAEASTVAEALMDNVINIEPMNTGSAAAAAAKEQDELEPGEVLNLRARALAAGGLSMVNRHAALQIPDLSSLTSHSVSTNHGSNQGSNSLPAPLGRTPLRHRRTIGELYGLMNPQRRGRGGATNHIAMKYRRDCPIPGCGARYLTNLCDHLKKTHGLGPEERRPWLEKAKRIHQQKQLQEQQQQLQSKSPSGNNTGSNRSTSSPQSQRRSPSTTSSATNPTAAQAAAAAANLAASPALAAIALATSQSTANLSSTDSIAMAMSQIPLNSAALLMQQAQALSLLNAQAFPSPNATFPGFSAALSAQRSSAASAGSAFPSFGALGGNTGVTGSRVRSPWNSSGSRKNCPVPSCGAKSLLNLSDHLSKVHSMTRDERQPWLQRARDELA